MDIDKFKRKVKRIWRFIKFNSVAIIFSLVMTILSFIVGLVPIWGDIASGIISIINFLGTQGIIIWKFMDLIMND